MSNIKLPKAIASQEYALHGNADIREVLLILDPEIDPEIKNPEDSAVFKLWAMFEGGEWTASIRQGKCAMYEWEDTFTTHEAAILYALEWASRAFNIVDQVEFAQVRDGKLR